MEKMGKFRLVLLKGLSEFQKGRNNWKSFMSLGRSHAMSQGERYEQTRVSGSTEKVPQMKKFEKEMVTVGRVSTNSNSCAFFNSSLLLSFSNSSEIWINYSGPFLPTYQRRRKDHDISNGYLLLLSVSTYSTFSWLIFFCLGLLCSPY